MIDNQNLWEFIDLSDIAIRAASQLRQAKTGQAITDPKSLERALHFLQSAKTGGEFLLGKGGYSKFEGTLKPLNWATDTYLQTASKPKNQNPDYDEVARYLDQIANALRQMLTTEKDAGAAVQLEKSIIFFQTLGDLLAARADQIMRHESSRAETENWVSNI